MSAGTMSWRTARATMRDLSRRLDQNSDPRIGSSQDNSTGGTLSHFQNGSNSASLSALGGTFIPVAIYSVICVALFLWLRRKHPRVYSPKTLPDIRCLVQEQPPQLPLGFFNWIKPFYKIPDETLLKYTSLDGFLFLRYLKILAVICLAGACVSWPLLLPVNGTGGHGLTELDLLTIGNVEDPTRFYAHVVVAWLFFGFVMFLISRECVYYVSLRQAYLLSPEYSQRLSSRTVLFTCVPQSYLDAARIRKLFGDSVKNVFIPQNTKRLKDLVKEREKTAMKLEKAEIALIRLVDGVRRKQAKSGVVHSEKMDSPSSPISASTNERTNSGKDMPLDAVLPTSPQPGPDSLEESAPAPKPSDPEYTHPYGLHPNLPDVRGSVAALYVENSARPRHRPISEFGRSVDTIRWARFRLKALAVEIPKLRRRLRNGRGIPINAVFVEFDSQANAQAAYQILAHHLPLHMSPRFIGIRPKEVVWGVLRMKWWERIMRRFAIMAAIALAIIFWSIPCAIIGLISNVGFIAAHFPPLFWLGKVPEAILGVIQGLLPAVALSLFMATVPMMLRGCARAAGVPTAPRVELYVQTAYFAFQVIQVFLVTTLTSAASAALTEIIQNPLLTPSILSQNLPKASNFYLSYILVQSLAGGASGLVHLLDLFRHEVMSKSMQIPRKRFKLWHRMRNVHWGSVYPVFSNMGVIALCYSCIAPLILFFAGVGMLCTYVVYKYNLIYIYDANVDSQGLFYPRALMHLMVGLYLAEICLVGLFALQAEAVPVVLMVIFLIFTMLVHISLSEALGPLFYNLPRTLALEMENWPGGAAGPDTSPDAPAEGQNLGSPSTLNGAAAEYYNVEEGFGMEDEDPTRQVSFTSVDDEEDMKDFRSKNLFPWNQSSRRGGELLPDNEPQGALAGSGTSLAIPAFIANFLNWVMQPVIRDENASFITKWLHPDIYSDFKSLSQIIPARLPLSEPSESLARHGYLPPEMWVQAPRLWIPQDEARVSRQEVAHTRDIVTTSDRGAWLDEKGRVVTDLNEAPFGDDGYIYDEWMK